MQADFDQDNDVDHNDFGIFQRAITGPSAGSDAAKTSMPTTILVGMPTVNMLICGIVREPILGQDAKREALERLARERGIALADTLAVGDGANDLAMIGVAGLGVAFHAKPRVAAAARVRIDHGDLTALLYLQGYRQSEFSQ